MSSPTVQSPGPVPARTPLDTSRSTGIPFGRLVGVEWRKMTDTRGGFWLLAITGVLLVITVAIVLLVQALDSVTLTASTWSTIMTIPLSLLLPAFAILTVTSEWSQRTGLVTFALEPRRIRVVLAKLCAVLVLVAATLVVATVLGAIGNVVGAGLAGDSVRWNLEPQTLIGTVLVQVVYFLMAFGLGMLLLNTPGAIAIFYVVALLLPLMVYSALYAFFEWARDLIPYIDLQYATAPLLDPTADITGTNIAQLVVAVLLWVVVPVGLGARRILGSEPK